MARVALDHGVGGLEAGVGDLGHVERLMVRLLRRDDWGVGHQREVDPIKSVLVSSQHPQYKTEARRTIPLQNQNLRLQMGGKCKREPWVRHKVGLKLSQVDVESPVEAEGGSDGGDHLAGKRQNGCQGRRSFRSGQFEQFPEPEPVTFQKRSLIRCYDVLVIPGQSACSGWHSWASRCRGSSDRCRRWPRCPP